MRKKKSILNIVSSLGSYFLLMLFTFLTQSVIVKCLGIEYSGINGLFTNIITMLSIAELGLGTTVIFKLYQPIATNNKPEIIKWVRFYRTCYNIVSLSVLLLGLVLIPFIPLIVGETTISENIYLLYILVLLDTVSSYLLAYKRSLLYADQKNYIINSIHMICITLLNVLQISLILLTKNYYLFLVVKPVFQLVENAIISVYVNKKYSFINDSVEKISKEEKSDFFKRIFAMFVQKISFVINKGTDSIIISLLFGVAAVGYYTNYNLIATTICGIIFQIISGFGASVGDLLTEMNPSKSYTIYKRINFLNFFFTGLGVVGYLTCIQPLISVWLGNDFLQSIGVTLSFGLYIFADSYRRSITIFKEAAGICKEDKKMYVYMALINIISSVVLAKLLGVYGVIIGTAISYFFLILYSYPKYIIRTIFKVSCLEYYYRFIIHVLTITVTALTSMLLVSIIDVDNPFLNLIVSGLISILVYFVFFVVFFHRSSDYHYYKEQLRRSFKGRFRRPRTPYLHSKTR